MILILIMITRKVVYPSGATCGMNCTDNFGGSPECLRIINEYTHSMYTLMNYIYIYIYVYIYIYIHVDGLLMNIYIYIYIYI